MYIHLRPKSERSLYMYMKSSDLPEDLSDWEKTYMYRIARTVETLHSHMCSFVCWNAAVHCVLTTWPHSYVAQSSPALQCQPLLPIQRL